MTLDNHPRDDRLTGFEPTEERPMRDWLPKFEDVTMKGPLPLVDEEGSVIFLTPGTLSLGIICVYCGYNAMDSCEPDEDSKAMMAGVRADFNRHMLEVHGIDNG